MNILSPGRRLPGTILLPALLAGALLGGCASNKTVTQTTFDLGAVTARAPNAPALTAAQIPASALAALSVADVNVPGWMDNTNMIYRLNYSNAQQQRPYVDSRWSMTPAELLGQRLKWRIVQAGGAVLSTSDSRVNVLQIDADDFSQSFESATQSQVQVALRATLLSGRKLVAQKSFVHTAASSPDAAGSAKALALASDEAITAVIAWLAGLPLPK